MIERNPEQRYSAFEILKHKWLEKYFRNQPPSQILDKEKEKEKEKDQNKETSNLSFM
jgi:serine/threonine protein kinase